MIDLHTHLLPGVDDGPATLEDAVALARDTVAAGVTAVAATPHVSSRYPTAPATIHRAVRTLRAALDAAGVPLEVHPGAEVTLEQAITLPDATLRQLRLGAGRFVLLECPLTAGGGDPGPLVAAVQRRGHRVLLAHPERSPLFQRDPSQVERLVCDGALTSVTAGALAGAFGAPARRLAIDLLDAGLVHAIASDMHDGRGRPPGILAALAPALPAVRGLEGTLGWLTHDVPEAILAGRPIPPGPAVGVTRSPARRRLRRRRRWGRVAW